MENILQARPSNREYVPETPEQVRRRDAVEDFRVEVHRVRNNEPVFEAQYPLLDRWGNPAGTGWTAEDVANMEVAEIDMLDQLDAYAPRPGIDGDEGYVEPMDIDLGGPPTAEPALMSWEAREATRRAMFPEPEWIFQSPPRTRRRTLVNYYESPFTITPGARENPIVIPDTPKKGTRENPIVID